MSEQVQIARSLIFALRSDATLISLLPIYNGVPAVFSHVPQDLTAYPYVVFYDSGLESDNNDCRLGFDGIINIHSWADDRDLATIANIQKAIYDVLNHAEFTMTGYKLIEIHQEFTTILRDPDGITLHGVQRYRIILQTDN